MAKKNFIPQKYKIWIEVRKKLKLSHVHLQMARELGLNPKKLPGLANTSGSRWKEPLPEYLEHLYQKNFKKPRPDKVIPLEEKIRLEQAKKAARKQAKSAAAEDEA